MTTIGAATRQPQAIALDTNILIHAWSKDSPWHQQAADLMDSLEFGTAEWAIPDPCLCEYYQVVTNSKKFPNPATPKQARGQIEFWLALHDVVVLCEFADERMTIGPASPTFSNTPQSKGATRTMLGSLGSASPTVSVSFGRRTRASAGSRG
jgi:hypothetical protein